MCRRIIDIHRQVGGLYQSTHWKRDGSSRLGTTSSFVTIIFKVPMREVGLHLSPCWLFIISKQSIHARVQYSTQVHNNNGLYVLTKFTFFILWGWLEFCFFRVLGIFEKDVHPNTHQKRNKESLSLFGKWMYRPCTTNHFSYPRSSSRFVEPYGDANRPTSPPIMDSATYIGSECAGISSHGNIALFYQRHSGTCQGTSRSSQAYQEYPTNDVHDPRKQSHRPWLATTLASMYTAEDGIMYW